MKKSILVFLIVLVVGGGIFYYTKNKNTPSYTGSIITPEKTTEISTKTFTIAQVATHTTEASCYSVINGKVYDLTAWINKHPGGDKRILSICGKDGSTSFNGEHGGEMKPEQILAGFQIGTLVQ